MFSLVRVAVAGWFSVALFVTPGASAALGTPDEAMIRRGPVSPAELVLLDRAEQVLIQRCMRGKGFAYWPIKSPDPAELRSFGYVIDDVAWAGRHGYGGEFDRAAEAEQRDNPNRTYLEGLPSARRPAFDTALWGSRGDEVLSVRLPTGPTLNTATTGCQAEAQQDLYGDLGRWFRASAVADNLIGVYAGRIERDPRLRRAERAWSRCMRRSGYDYANPGAIRAALPRLRAGKTAGASDALDRRLAVAEATCARSSPLANVARKLEHEYGDPVRKTYKKEIDAKKRMQLAALLRAGRSAMPRIP